MSAHAYTEDQLVEQPAIGLFAELGWTTVSALEEVFHSSSPQPVKGEGAYLGRETKGEVVLVPPVARGAGAVESRATAGGHHRRRG